MNKDQDLTDALKFVVEGKAEQAISKASPWADAWTAKCIIFLANSFFLIDIETAMEVFGGNEGVKKLMTSERVERYFLRGWGALFRKEEEESELAFESAYRIASDDPFVQFSLAYVYIRHQKMNKVFPVISQMAEKNPSHPLLFLLRDLVLR